MLNASLFIHVNHVKETCFKLFFYYSWNRPPNSGHDNGCDLKLFHFLFRLSTEFDFFTFYGNNAALMTFSSSLNETFITKLNVYCFRWVPSSVIRRKKIDDKWDLCATRHSTTTKPPSYGACITDNKLSCSFMDEQWQSGEPQSFLLF